MARNLSRGCSSASCRGPGKVSLRAPTEPLGSGLADRPAAVRSADDLNGTFRQLGGTLFWGPYTKDPTI